ncbi:MAG TPA: PP2C family protein-serine/threonine phosphatase [Candidatus Solibacter sp.]|nr:PP2C family protein-serine/threonine phosphatase [Candidatus Solibacter sp.]
MMTDQMVVDVSQDWILACDVQKGFMQAPSTINDSLDYSARCRQIRALGGDCYSFIPLKGKPLKSDQLALVVGDASGKGLAAALMIANVQSSLRTAALFTGADLAMLFKAVNHQAYASSLADRYATLFYGVFDNAKRTLRYVNAGHNAPVVLRRDGSVEWLETSGAPVGMFPDSIYEEKFIGLEPGDLLIAYTDGVVEAANPDGQEWGVEGLLTAARYGAQRVDKASDLVDLVLYAMDDFSERNQTDDATLAVVRVTE